MLTPAERKLWQVLRSRQFGAFKFRRQQPIGSYIADFVCNEARLIIEADGGQHAESRRDEQRDSWLSARGYPVLRFWNNDIMGNVEGVLQAIALALDTPHLAQAAPESPSPSRGEGIGAFNA